MTIPGNLIEDFQHRAPQAPDVPSDLVASFQAKQPVPNDYGATDAVAHGLTRGFSEKGSAAIRALVDRLKGQPGTYGDLYKADLAERQAQAQQYQQAHPTANKVGQFIGEYMPFAGVGFPSGWMGRAAAGAAVGASDRAANAAAAAPPGQEAQAARGAAPGGALTGAIAAPLGGALLSRLAASQAGGAVTGALNTGARMLSGAGAESVPAIASSPEGVARSIIAQHPAFQDQAGMAQQAMRSGGNPRTLAGVGDRDLTQELLAQVAKGSKPGLQQFEQTAAGAKAAAAPLYQKAFQGLTPDQQAEGFWENGTDAFRRAALGNRKADIDRSFAELLPAERSLVQQHVGITPSSAPTPRMVTLTDPLRKALDNPILAHAYETGRGIAATEGVQLPPYPGGTPEEAMQQAAKNVSRSFGGASDLVDLARTMTPHQLSLPGNERFREALAGGDQLPLQGIDYMKRGLDKLIDKGEAGPYTIDQTAARALRGRLNRVLDLVNEQVPEYGKARATAAVYKQLEDAIGQGQSAKGSTLLTGEPSTLTQNAYPLASTAAGHTYGPVKLLLNALRGPTPLEQAGAPLAKLLTTGSEGGDALVRLLQSMQAQRGGSPIVAGLLAAGQQNQAP